MNCAGANLVPCRGSVQASDQYILLAWTQVPHRELPSCDKGDFRRQGQKSKRHHGRVKRILRKAAGTRPSTRLQKYCSQPPWVHHTHSSLPFSCQKLPKREQEPRDPPPPCLVRVGVRTQPTWRQILKNSPRWNTTNGRKKMRIGHHSWLKLGQPFWWLKDKRKLALQERKN